MNPFDYVNSITLSKKNLIVDEETEKGYQPWLTNQALAYHPDMIFYAQEMNINPHLDNKLQFDYLINSIRSAKRKRVQWIKKVKDDDLDVIREYYGYNRKNAQAALSILSEEQLKIIKTKIQKGGNHE